METVLSQSLLMPGSPAGADSGHTIAPEPFCAGVLSPVTFVTCPFFRLSLPQRLSAISSSVLTTRNTDLDSVVSSANENLFNSYSFAPVKALANVIGSGKGAVIDTEVPVRIA